jgi:energy-coupling factor transporter ATP-binding protein EcfA2
VLGAICAWSISSPAAQDSVQQASFQAQTKQTFNMTSIKPKLSMRPITTPVNLLVCGASGCGKSSFIRAFAKMLNQGAATSVDAATHDDAAAESWRVSGTGPSADPHAVLLAGADEFAAVVGPLSVPEAGRELLYKLQVSCCTDAAA